MVPRQTRERVEGSNKEIRQGRSKEKRNQEGWREGVLVG